MFVTLNDHQEIYNTLDVLNTKYSGCLFMKSLLGSPLTLTCPQQLCSVHMSKTKTGSFKSRHLQLGKTNILVFPDWSLRP